MQRIGVRARFQYLQNNGSVRICVDYTRLNNAVCRERYTFLLVEQTIDSLAEAKVFSKLDANRGFWLIPLSPELSLYTTFSILFGRFYFNRNSIASAPGTFSAVHVEDY